METLIWFFIAAIVAIVVVMLYIFTTPGWPDVSHEMWYRIDKAIKEREQKMNAKREKYATNKMLSRERGKVWRKYNALAARNEQLHKITRDQRKHINKLRFELYQLKKDKATAHANEARSILEKQNKLAQKIKGYD